MTQTRNDEGLGQRGSSCDEKDAMDLGADLGNEYINRK